MSIVGIIMGALTIGVLPALLLWCWWKLASTDPQKLDDWANNKRRD